MGPSAFRVAGLAERLRNLGCEVVDHGDVECPVPEECEIGDPRQKYAEDIRDVCEEVRARAYGAAREGALPLVLGGDHSLAMGSVAGVAQAFRERGTQLGLLWFDAHGDMNVPESSPSGNVHGMPLAHLIGMGSAMLRDIGGFSPKVRVEHTVLIGLRDLDAVERRLVSESGVHVFTMKDLDRDGAGRVMERALAYATAGTAGIYVSLDMDALDPAIAPGVGTPRKGGLSYREAHLCMELVADSGLLAGMDVVEVNPTLDHRNSTAELGVELILSAFGKRIV
jgi:arginase